MSFPQFHVLDRSPCDVCTLQLGLLQPEADHRRTEDKFSLSLVLPGHLKGPLPDLPAFDGRDRQVDERVSLTEGSQLGQLNRHCAVGGSPFAIGSWTSDRQSLNCLADRLECRAGTILAHMLLDFRCGYYGARCLAGQEGLSQCFGAL